MYDCGGKWVNDLGDLKKIRDCLNDQVNISMNQVLKNFYKKL